MVGLIAAVLLISAGPTAGPDALAAIEAREADAKVACAQGRVGDAVAILGLLFDRTGDSGYLFNQGRCFQQNGRRDEALVRFRAFLERPDITLEARARAEQYVDELERMPTPRPRLLALGRATAPAAEPAAVAAPAAEAPRAQGGTRPLRVAAVAAAGVAVAAVGTAVYFGLRVRDITSTRDRELAAPEPPPPERLYQLDSRGRSAESLQWVFLGAGAVALATGTACYVVDRRLARGQERTSVTLLVAPGGGGALVSGSF